MSVNFRKWVVGDIHLSN